MCARISNLIACMNSSDQRISYEKMKAMLECESLTHRKVRRHSWSHRSLAHVRTQKYTFSVGGRRMAPTRAYLRIPVSPWLTSQHETLVSPRIVRFCTSHRHPFNAFLSRQAGGIERERG
ncbi:uncharacterized protein LOC143178539 [Calliopsis andreniformis]|uniref:uncharacterized protein LOC143178539 n=1 Tax=Calliopsis andreniformis TaxID=337506 RepID=UPI003FCCB067